MADFRFAVSVDGGVAHIDLNRPEEKNALTRDMMVQLSATLREVARDEAVGVIALRARGDTFCRGRDGRGEGGFATPQDRRVKAMGPVLDVYDAIASVPQPVVALVQGPALGFGCALAGACDITLAAESAHFAFTEIKHGIPPTMAMAAVLRNVPSKALAYLIYSAEAVSARDAVGLGLASKVFPDADFAAECDRFLAGLAAHPRLVLETIKTFQGKATGLPRDMVSEYAGTLLALVRS